MPEGEHFSFLEKESWLSFREIERLVRAFVQIGVDKVRITGGEPLVRPGCADLVHRLSLIEGVKDLALTTNGSLLGKYALALKEAGLKRLTVSLDSLDTATFQQMNGVRQNPQEILAAIFQARRLGFEDIKVNCVLHKGRNEKDILPLARVFRNSGVVLRFIEYMDVGTRNQWRREQVVPSQAVLAKIEEEFPLQALSPNYLGEVASRYAYRDGGGEIGFISSVTQPFCRDCSRARVSADGHLYTCLFAQEGMALKPWLKQDDEALRGFIAGLWKKRRDRYSEERQTAGDFERDQKVEMFRIGG